MSFAADAPRVRDESLPLGRRVKALHQCIQMHSPLGFENTRQALRRRVGATDHRWTALVPFRRTLWTGDQLVAALDLLEESRRTWVAYQQAFATRRRAEKPKGWRQPTRGDLEALTAKEWFKDPARAHVRIRPEA